MSWSGIRLSTWSEDSREASRFIEQSDVLVRE